ncbi:MAG: 4-hydroxythreonine-4-phosphate dehydrogenase PdxA [Candidatus Omnitrophica bacterium]|nr:4-hydroxythreonine-4-phosphate dehydrogenase PdxA [Candidatus Omnitrophota bacterium]
MRISHSNRKLIVVTSGDPGGIGPETILKAIYELNGLPHVDFLVIGDFRVFVKNAEALNLDISPLTTGLAGTTKREGIVNFIDLRNVPPAKFKFGTTGKLYGRASIEYLHLAVSIIKKIKSAALVTAPISKASINDAGFKFAGHTEFLCHAAGVKNVTMMLVGRKLKVSLVTRHVPLREAARYLTAQRIVDTALHTEYALKTLFKMPNPRIGIAGLNPHAGENGFLGNEEERIIKPAVSRLSKNRRNIKGPYPPDIIFYKALKGELDAVVCMYHDQGLIPFKMLAFDNGVNLTVGLPFLRTSPDHGTGLDIAGKCIANPRSMIEAIKLAAGLRKPLVV